MTTINIGGKRVTVSDDFLKLSPEQQSAAVEEIAGSMGNSKVDPATNQPPGVPAYVPPGVKGYDPQTGEVAPGQNTSFNDKGLAFTSSVLNGVPIAGPYLKEGVESLGAKIGAATSGKSEADIRYASDQATNRAVEDNPYTSLAGGVTGAVAGTLPAVAAAPEAFGAGTAGLGVRSILSALTGGSINAADSAVRSGGDWNEIGKGAGIGLGLGLIAPGAGQLIGKGIGAAVDYAGRPAASALQGFSRDALARISKALTADGLTPEAAAQRLAQLGPDATLADLGPNLQQTAAGLVAKPGEARGIVQNAMRGREAGASGRIAQALDDTIGPAPVPSQVDAGLRASQRSLGPAYDDALSSASAVDTQPIANALDSQVVNLRGEAQAAVQRVRSMLNVHGADVLDTHPGALLQTRQAIDGMLDGATDGNVRRVLTQTRQAVDDQLAQAVPGIKQVDAQYAELARQRGALESGQTVLDSGRTSPRPQELAQQVQEGALPQGAQIGPSAVPVRLRQGARAEIDRIVGTNANDRVALQRIVKGEGDWNPQKLATLFGPDRARRIIDVLDAEKTFAGTNNFVTQNSATAARQEAVRDLDGAGAAGLGVVDSYKAGGVLGLGRAGALKGASAVIDALRGRGASAAQAALARGLVSGDHAAVVQALIAASPVPVPTATISKIAEALLLGSGTASAR